MSDYIAKQGTTALGIIGTALGGLSAVGGLGGMLGVGQNTGYMTKSQAVLMQQNTSKDAEIALLKANADTDKKLADVYQAAADRDSKIRSEIYNEFKDIRATMNNMQTAQDKVNAAQAVDNATTASTIAVLGANQQNIQNVLNGLTKTVIPNSNVCPGFMPLPTYQVQAVSGTIANCGTTIA